MADYQKKQIQDLLESIHELHNVIKKDIELKLYSSVFRNLQDCQEAAIEIGTWIERTEVDKKETVILLERYCEQIYKCNQKLGESDADTLYYLLEDALSKAENSFVQDILSNKIEIVFFPYKASMWDSLESIWMVAREDNRCECYVVPIPYFDKKKDGTLGEMHYEGHMYPDYVPIVDWQKYDVARRRPDIAYIHNPYDQMNYVTSVHPVFYAKELKRHVGTLIYCPYFVLEGQANENFCLVPGVLWADKVILQSENMREQYIKLYKTGMNNSPMTEKWGTAEEKFVALGSPKIDKVLACNSYIEPLPEEWKKLVKGKKIVLYNTHLGDVLQFGNVFFDKLRSVLVYFQKNEKYVLWWRPHPLSNQTIEAMRPELLSEYQQIVETYLTDHYGIFDNTPELYRALKYADFYYGSGSSLVPLFGIMGKPVIMQNILCVPEIIKDVECAYTITGNVLYIVVEKIAALVSFNLITHKWKVEMELPVEYIPDVPLYFSLFVVEQKLYLFPQNAQNLLIYHLVDQTYHKIDLPVIKPGKRQYYFMQFAEVLLIDNNFIIMPHSFPAIWSYNIKSNEILHYTEWIKEIKKWLPEYQPADHFFRVHSVCNIGEFIFAVLCTDGADVICCFKAPEMKLVKIYKELPQGTLQCMETDGDNIWMVYDLVKEIICWNFQTNENTRYQNDFWKEIKAGNIARYRLVNIRNKISVWPKICNTKFCIDKDLKSLTTFGSADMASYMGLPQVIEDKLYVINKSAGTLEIWNSELEMEQSIKLTWPEEWPSANFENRLLQSQLSYLKSTQEEKYILEKNYLHLPAILNSFSRIENIEWNNKFMMRKYADIFSIEEQSAGFLIHRYVMEYIKKRINCKNK